MTISSCEAEVTRGMIFSQPEDPLLRSVLSLLRVARDQGRVLNRTKVAKLLYLADLCAVESGGVAFTGATWRWENHGPFDPAQYRVEDALVASGLVERVQDPQSPCGEVRLHLAEDIDAPLSLESLTVLGKVVAEHGDRSAAQLRDLAYETAPMVQAQTDGEHGVLLDLNRARRRKQYAALKERYRARAADRGPVTSDPGVGEDLLAEMAESAEIRRRASMKALGEE
ncbi:type II toxin-antitoxin system antitoxin SocA domain-containing protein [Nocardiopsis algeriensis]|uniref:Putative phage-associated protein n=1 Tax=Nocardiopsis algeriensis TaxID=1478215 RepID=A0A841IT66_9ACTN|nr:type II toxin-antitoxin system antitoxin SocA domain-containing protein [Nocardiopsis algeriensis]MBB6119451.1 putative phage-associated protein [Nocardiopsis algeriensis]